MSRSLYKNRDLEKLEPYEGKLSSTVLRGEEGSNALDLPDRPSDLAQRDGRAVRKGNEIARLYADNKVDVIIYAVEKSLDSYKFNLLHCKQTFISQLKSGAMGARTIDEGSMDEKSGMNFSEYMAILSGNTDLLDKARLEKKVAALESERKSFNRAKHETENRLLEMTNHLVFDKAAKEKMSEDWKKFEVAAGKDKEGNYLNALVLDGFPSRDEKVLGAKLQDIDKNVNTGGAPQRIGELYGFEVSVTTERMMSEGLELTQNRFSVKGNYKYTHNHGQIAKADKEAAARNFLRALEHIPQTIAQYGIRIEEQEQKVAQMQPIVAKEWKKEDELKQLKSELAALDRKIQLKLAPPEPEIVEKTTNVSVDVGNEEVLSKYSSTYGQTCPTTNDIVGKQLSSEREFMPFPRLDVAKEERQKGFRI